MATKTLTIMEDAYEMLKSNKKTDESFSDVVRRVCSDKKSDLTRFFGAFDKETCDDLRRLIKEGRKNSSNIKLMRG